MEDTISDNNSTPKRNTTEENVSFSNITAVAKIWMIDFSFVSLCRYFKDDVFDEFSRTLSTLEAIEGHSHLGPNMTQKITIAAFLARIVQGKQLDVEFDSDDHVMPLMSATKIWTTLRDTVADEGTFNHIANLLFVQSVAVCLEKGLRSKASGALLWLQEEHDLPQNLGFKLSLLVKTMDTYHPFLLQFSFSHLLEAVQSYLDTFLEENPSDFLLQAATKVARSSKNTDTSQESVALEDQSPSETADEPAEAFKKNNCSVLTRTRRNLLAMRNTELWKPDSGKKLNVHLNRIKENDASLQFILIPPSERTILTRRKGSPEKSLNTTLKRRKKWSEGLDKLLIAGVMRHGKGRWSKILLDYDFRGRTGVMLKDRWRVLKRQRANLDG